MAKAKKKKAKKKAAKKKALKKVSKKKAAPKKRVKKAAKRVARKTAKKKASRKAPQKKPAERREPVMSHGSFCHVEIPAADTAAAKAFYGGVFGWTFQDVPGEMPYTFYQTRQGAIGGGIMNPPEGAPRRITNYIAVDDIDRTAAQIESRGGRIVVPKTEIPGYGWMVHFLDPEGNLLALWKPAPMS